MSTDSTHSSNTKNDAESNFVRAKIFGDHYAEIRKTDLTLPWSEEIHAVNWFNTRSLALYNFYNLIASRSVIKVGGKPLFKGRLTKTLIGDEQDARSVLLLVRYPSALNFRTMLENTYFKTVSIIRGIAVSDFTFCLTKVATVTELAALKQDSQQYLIHHFRGDNEIINRAREAAKAASIDLVFASLKSHQILMGKSNGDETPVPDLLDGVLLFRAPNDTSLESFIESNSYKEITDSTQSSFIGLLNRLM